MAISPRPGILDVEPYQLGEWTIPGRDRVIRLASNECAAEPSPRAVAAYREFIPEIRRYPDGFLPPLREAIAARHGLDAGRVVLGDGSEELINLLARAYAGPGDEVLCGTYSYLLFRIAATTAGATAVMAPDPGLRGGIDALIERAGPRTRLVFLANPANPTGSCLDRAEIERLRRSLPDDALLVLDGAYAEYATADDYDPGTALVEAGDNVVMLRTFSKIYGLAGLRIGWAYGPESVAGVLDRLRPPSNVAGPAAVAATAALGDTDHIARSRADNARRRVRFAAEAARLGLRPYPSEGNFVLVRFPDERAKSAAAAHTFLKSRGILVRPMEAYGLDDCLRVTIGNDDEMAAVAAALGDFVS